MTRPSKMYKKTITRHYIAYSHWSQRYTWIRRVFLFPLGFLCYVMTFLASIKQCGPVVLEEFKDTTEAIKNDWKGYYTAKKYYPFDDPPGS